MTGLSLRACAAVACAAADAARAEILPRFAAVTDLEVDTKADGSPVTEADRAAERAIRAVLAGADPGTPVVGEEFGADEVDGAHDRWVVDPIDGTIGFTRGLPLFGTLIARVAGGREARPVVGVLDLPALDERYVAWRGGGAWCGGKRLRVSSCQRLADALVSHGDAAAFREFGVEPVLRRLVEEAGMLRGYTDAFGHALVLGGGVDVMVDPALAIWDVAASQVLIDEAGGKLALVESDAEGGAAVGRACAVLGAPALVDELAAWVDGALGGAG